MRKILGTMLPISCATLLASFSVATPLEAAVLKVSQPHGSSRYW